MTHPLVAIWCHPRSRSTALERAMIERGDLEVIHEPFSYLYYVHRQARSVPHLAENPEQPRTYDEIRTHLLAASGRGPVLLKDMAYHCLDELLQDRELLERMVHAFLIRDPAQAIASHYAVNPECTLEEIGIEQLCLLFRGVRDVCGRVPPVITAETLVRDPEAITTRFAEAVGLPAIEGAVRWQPGHRAEWDSWKEWHRDAASSSGIHDRSRTYEFTIENHSELRRLYDHHLPFYEELRAHAREEWSDDR